MNRVPARRKTVVFRDSQKEVRNPAAKLLLVGIADIAFAVEVPVHYLLRLAGRQGFVTRKITDHPDGSVSVETAFKPSAAGLQRRTD